MPTTLLTAPREQAKSAVTLPGPLSAAAARLRGGSTQVRSEVRCRELRAKPVPRRAKLDPEPRPEACQTSALPPRLLGVREAGSYLGVSPFTIRNMLKDKRLCPVRVPGLIRVLVDRLDLDQLIEGWKV